MSTQPGLRERKKRQTRELIAAVAHRLFGERGFDAVTVAEVARAADVSEGTVYNHFPTKEDSSTAGWRRSRPSWWTPSASAPLANRSWMPSAASCWTA